MSRDQPQPGSFSHRPTEAKKRDPGNEVGLIDSTIKLFLKLGVINIHDMNIKQMGSPCLFKRQRALKMEYFYWLLVRNSNHLHTELSLGYPKDTKFYLESKASFIDTSSIAPLKLFLVTWLREYCTFSDSSWLA